MGLVLRVIVRQPLQQPWAKPSQDQALGHGSDAEPRLSFLKASSRKARWGLVSRGEQQVQGPFLLVPLALRALLLSTLVLGKRNGVSWPVALLLLLLLVEAR